MKKLLIILAVPGLFFLGCKPKSPTPTNTTPPSPVACFSINKSLIDSGETIITSNCSQHASSYAWNFGLGLQSSSTTTSPSFTYSASTGIKRGKTYTIKLIAYGSGTTSNEKDTNIVIGERQIDSIKVVNLPVVPPYNYTPDGSTKIAIQFGPGPNTSEFTSDQVAPSAWPYTFNLDGLSPKIKIGPTNNQAWRGRVIDISTSHDLYNFGAGTPIYFSRGIDNNPIKITDSQGFEMDVYYSLVP